MVEDVGHEVPGCFMIQQTPHEGPVEQNRAAHNRKQWLHDLTGKVVARRAGRHVILEGTDLLLDPSPGGIISRRGIKGESNLVGQPLGVDQLVDGACQQKVDSELDQRGSCGVWESSITSSPREGAYRTTSGRIEVGVATDVSQSW